MVEMGQLMWQSCGNLPCHSPQRALLCFFRYSQDPVPFCLVFTSAAAYCFNHISLCSLLSLIASAYPLLLRPPGFWSLLSLLGFLHHWASLPSTSISVLFGFVLLFLAPKEGSDSFCSSWSSIGHPFGSKFWQEVTLDYHNIVNQLYSNENFLEKK